MAEQVRAMIHIKQMGAHVFAYGSNLRGQALLAGVDGFKDIPGFVPAYIRPLFCEGKGPFRWAALSGDPADIGVTDKAVLDEFPDNEGLARWIRLASDRVAFQGLPARICWLRYGEPHPIGLRFHQLGVRPTHPGTGPPRHADAGYPEAERVADATGMHLPMRR